MKRKNKRKTNQKPKTAKPKPQVVKQNIGPGEHAGETFVFLKKDVYICCGIFFSTLLVYILTLAPTVFFGDSGELTAAAYNLGIAHPPGYPLYLLLGKLFMLLVPFGDMAMRMNLLSAFFASLTAVMIYLINRALSHGRLVSVSVSLIAAFSFTFWSQAVVAEVYTLSALFFCTLIFFTLLWLKDREERWLLLLALTAGLALTHHVIIALYYPVFFIFILLRNYQFQPKNEESQGPVSLNKKGMRPIEPVRDGPRLLKNWKLIVKTVALFLLPLLLYLYLPIRSAANPLNDWGNPETLSAMMDHITAKQFGGLFLKHGFEGVLFQFKLFTRTLLEQFPLILLILAAIGVIAGLMRQRKAALFFLVLLLVNLSYSIAYYITDIEAHFITLFLLLALFMGMVLHHLHGWIQKNKRPLVHRGAAVILLIIACLPLGFNWKGCDRGGNTLARDYGQNILDSLDPRGVLFIDSEKELFIAAYLRIVEGLRPDVDLYDARQNIFFIPAIKTKGKEEVTVEHLNRFAQEMVAEKRPVYFTNPIFGNFKFADYGVLYRVLPGNGPPPPARDAWAEYDLRGVYETYTDAGSKETAGNYFFKRAAYLAKTNQGDLSGDFIEKALAAAGDRYPILKNIGIFYMQARRHKDAEKLLKKAVKLNPFDSDSYNMLGMSAHYRSATDEALVYYDKALELKENSISPLMNRGMLYEQMGDKEPSVLVKKNYYQKALIDMEHALKIEPSNPATAKIKNRISYKLAR